MRRKSSMKFLKRVLSIVVFCCIITQLFSLTVFATNEIKGDVNGDGNVSVSDARMVLNHLAKLEEEIQILGFGSLYMLGRLRGLLINS